MKETAKMTGKVRTYPSKLEGWGFREKIKTKSTSGVFFFFLVTVASVMADFILSAKHTH